MRELTAESMSDPVSSLLGVDAGAVETRKGRMVAAQALTGDAGRHTLR